MQKQAPFASTFQFGTADRTSAVEDCDQTVVFNCSRASATQRHRGQRRLRHAIECTASWTARVDFTATRGAHIGFAPGETGE